MNVTLHSWRQPALLDSVVLFYGVNEEGRSITVAVDHRPAEIIAEQLLRSGEPLDCQVEDWQVVRIEPPLSAEERRIKEEELEEGLI